MMARMDGPVKLTQGPLSTLKAKSGSRGYSGARIHAMHIEEMGVHRLLILKSLLAPAPFAPTLLLAYMLRYMHGRRLCIHKLASITVHPFADPWALLHSFS